MKCAQISLQSTPLSTLTEKKLEVTPDARQPALCDEMFPSVISVAPPVQDGILAAAALGTEFAHLPERRKAGPNVAMAEIQVTLTREHR